MASILSWLEVSLSTRSAKKRKLSCSVTLAGHVDCIFSVFADWACAGTASAATSAAVINSVRMFPLLV